MKQLIQHETLAEAEADQEAHKTIGCSIMMVHFTDKTRKLYTCRETNKSKIMQNLKFEEFISAIEDANKP